MRALGAEVEGGKWDRGGLPKAADEETGGGSEVASGGAEGVGEGDTKGSGEG